MAEDAATSRINTYDTLHLNPFTAACSGSNEDDRILSQLEGEIVAYGRDRSHTQVCKWSLKPYAAGSITIDIDYNFRRHKDRIEIWDYGQYVFMGEEGYEMALGECNPCAFPMQNDDFIPDSMVPYMLTSNFKGHVEPSLTASVSLRVGPSAEIMFYSDSSAADDGIPFAELSETLGPNAFRLRYQASPEMYLPPSATPTRRSSSPSTGDSAATASSQELGAAQHREAPPGAAATSAQGSHTVSSKHIGGGKLHKHNEHSLHADKAPGASSSRQQCEFPESLELEFGDDWAWKKNLPKAFSPATVRFVRQEVEQCADGEQDQLQGEWEGETFAQGLASGVAEFVGNGRCGPENSILAAESNNIATSRDACLEICGSFSDSKCTFFSFAEGTGTCQLFSACPGSLRKPPNAASEFFTWEVPHHRFVTLTCNVRMMVRETQISAHIYACGGSADGIRRSFQEGFNHGTAHFACKTDRACTDPQTFPCLYKDPTTSYVYFQYYPFTMTWTTRAPDRAAGMNRGLYSFSVVGNGFLYEGLNLEMRGTLQVCQALLYYHVHTLKHTQTYTDIHANYT